MRHRKQWGHNRSDEHNSLGERGTTLLETVLTIALLGSLLAFVNGIVGQESARQRDRSLGQELRLMTQFAQQYVKAEYTDLLQSLANLPTNYAIMEVSMQTLANDGYLPASFLQAGRHLNSEGQEYAILVRGVSRRDNSNPKATLPVSTIDANDDDLVDPHFVDGQESNDELDIEAVLVTTGGNPLPAQHGNPAAAAAELATVGFVQKQGTASGAFGAWSLNISPFNSLRSYPSTGHFVALLALSGFGVLDFQSFAQSTSGQTNSNPFERCPGLSGVALANCGANNSIYTDMQFRSADTDGDGVADRFGKIGGAYAINMPPPADTDANGRVDLFPEITGLLRIACDSSGTSSVSTGTILVDCANVHISGSTSVGGNLEVSGNATITGRLNLVNNLTVGDRVDANRYIAKAIGGQDLTKGFFRGEIIDMSGTRQVDKPICRDASSEPEIYVAPASFASPDGSPIVGLKAIAEAVRGQNKWLVNIQAALDRDSNNDRSADVVELRSADDRALAVVKCS